MTLSFTPSTLTYPLLPLFSFVYIISVGMPLYNQLCFFTYMKGLPPLYMYIQCKYKLVSVWHKLNDTVTI